MRIVLIVSLVIVATLVGAGWLYFMFNSNIEGYHIEPAAIRNK